VTRKRNQRGKTDKNKDAKVTRGTEENEKQKNRPKMGEEKGRERTKEKQSPKGGKGAPFPPGKCKKKSEPGRT